MPTPSTSLDDAGQLEELRTLQLLASPIEPEFDNLTQLASEICDTPVALISFVDQDQIWFKSPVGFDALHGPRENSFCSHAIQGNGPLVVEDATVDPRFQENVYVKAPQGVRFYAGIPLVLSSGHAIGTLCVLDYKTRTLSDKQLGRLKKLARQVTALFEAKRIALRLKDESRSRLVIEQRLDFALQAAEIGDWDMDLRTNVARRSLKHDQCFGYTEAVPQWGYDTFLAHVIDDDRARVDACYQRAMAGLGAYDVEFRVLWPDQTLHWLWSKGRFYFDESGKPNRVAGIQVDITERKQAEEALQHTQALLANAEKIGRVGGWEIDVQTLQMTWTEAVYDIYELDSNDRLTVDEGINYYTPVSQPIIEQAVQRAIEHGEPFDLELEIISAKGNLRYVHAVGKADRARGKVSGFFQDITVAKRASQALSVANQELSRSNADLEQFAYAASHDLLEPLRSVSSSLQLLQRRCSGQLDATADNFIHHAVDGSTRMQAMIMDLLAYSRVRADGEDNKPVSMKLAFDRACGNLGEAIVQSAAHITCGELPTLEGHLGQLTQLFQNLVGNALKFNGGKPAVVEVQAQQQAKGWLFSVKDHGIGIEAQHLERIFMLFKRLHTREEYAGTGIGLTLCKKIVERHGGTIWVESVPGVGTTVFFTLPASASAA